jgi:predicted MFS family arabinose efflux permease
MPAKNFLTEPLKPKAMTSVPTKEKVFSRYQVFIIAILALLQFTVILDFMVLSPLGAMLLQELNISTSQFGLVVSAYAFSAGASGLLAAGFADQFDRKKLMLFFYTGFMVGTLLCAVATSYSFLLIARIVTGIFGGVISSIGFAIITDLFKLEVRGRVMGFVQMAFGASQVLGIPIGLLLANRFGWHSPFWMIAGFGIVLGLVILRYMQPVTEHLKVQSTHSPFRHLINTFSKSHYVRAFMATTLLATGGFMLMPFGSAFSIHNLGLTLDQLPILYGITGVFSFVTGPLAGKLSDKIGKYQLFVMGSLLSMLLVAIYTQLGLTPLWLCIVLNVILFAGISARMISASALMSAIPAVQDRGAFMSINASVQQISGGVAAAVAGMIVVQSPGGQLLHYPTLGYVVIGSMLAAIGLMYRIHRSVSQQIASQSVAEAKPIEASS